MVHTGFRLPVIHSDDFVHAVLERFKILMENLIDHFEDELRIERNLGKKRHCRVFLKSMCKVTNDPRICFRSFQMISIFWDLENMFRAILNTIVRIEVMHTRYCNQKFRIREDFR